MAVLRASACSLAAAMVAAAAAATSEEGSCGMGGPMRPDCEFQDMGSCGEACCAATVALAASPAEAYEKVAAYLKAGGGDGLFTYVTGPDKGGNNPSDNISSYKIDTGKGSTWEYILKGTHETKVRHYLDDLYVAFHTAPGGGCVLRMFSVSLIHGALGDIGQNYKTLAYLSKAVGAEQRPSPIWGCGLPASSMPPAKVFTAVGAMQLVGVAGSSASGQEHSAVAVAVITFAATALVFAAGIAAIAFRSKPATPYVQLV